MGCAYSRNCISENCFPREAQPKGKSDVQASSEIPMCSPKCSEDQGRETRDQYNQLGVTRDLEADTSTLSRVSSQFLTSEGSRTVKVPSRNYELRYSYLSQRGYYPDALDKANQDSFCIHTPFGVNPDDHFFGVFDGHGEFGAQCSQFVKQKLSENLLKNLQFGMDAVEACDNAFLTTNSELHADSLNDSMSGTTAITVLVRGQTIYVANSGDSRAVIAERRGLEVVAVDLSLDQTPFRTDELERVKLCGARVLTMDQIEGLKDPNVHCWGSKEGDDGDPPRLWMQNGMYPGTAFTRSIGDSVAEGIGVVATPEIVVLELSPSHPFIVVASDGVFEFLSSQSVIDMVEKFEDPRDACAAVVAESYRLWLQYETRTDDITVIVVQINGLTDAAFGQSASCGLVLEPPVSQVVEATGSKHDLSKSYLRAIESSLENGQVWIPPVHKKTFEEEAHIERALQDHFLFNKLTGSQGHVLLDCMQRLEVKPGDVVLEQGSESDCFYVVGSGEFEALATQGDKNGDIHRVLQQYTAEKLSSFGELALMYNKRLQASVRAVTSGTLWALKREDFRAVFMSEFSNLALLKLLRSVDPLSRLTILQLNRVADSLSDLSFSDGQTIIHQDDSLSALYVIQKGQVRITFGMDLEKCPYSLLTENKKQGDTQSNDVLSVVKAEGTYFGEWTLLGERLGSLNAVAVGDVVCSVLNKENIESVVGPLLKPSDADQNLNDNLNIIKEYGKVIDPSKVARVHISDLDWRTTLCSTDCSEIGIVRLGESENLLSLKRFSKQKVKRLDKQVEVLKEKELMKSLSSSACVPQILCTCADQTYAGILLNTCLAGSFSSILHSALDEPSAQYCAASVVIALEDLHKKNVLYRGVSPDVLMFDQTGHLQLVDFRFGKQLHGERTFTICGMADSLAPEVLQEKGHSLPADWWALGVLIYFMLHGEMPFGSWKESGVDIYEKIAKGQLTLPPTFSPEAADLIMKLLEVDENARLGGGGPGSVKSHPWFNGVDWKGIAAGSFPVPDEITSHIRQYLTNRSKDCSVAQHSPSRDVEVIDSAEWLEDW